MLVKGKNSVFIVLFIKKMKVLLLVVLDNCKVMMVLGLGSVFSLIEVCSSESGVRVLLLYGFIRDYLMYYYYEFDVVISSNNVMVFNLRSRRISFLGRNVGGFMEEEDLLKRVYL